MAELFLALSGPLANSVLDFYLEYQLLFNTVVVLYGALLAVAHFNLQRIESFLLEQYETEDLEEALEALARESDESIVERINNELRFPVIASPYFFAVHRVSRRALIVVIGKKEKIPGRRLEELLALEHSETRH
ncbi:MAG: hypothetical protein ACLFP6_07170 [Spirochaetaceae bacterium]